MKWERVKNIHNFSFYERTPFPRFYFSSTEPISAQVLLQEKKTLFNLTSEKSLSNFFPSPSSLTMKNCEIETKFEGRLWIISARVIPLKHRKFFHLSQHTHTHTLSHTHKYTHTHILNIFLLMMILHLLSGMWRNLFGNKHRRRQWV